MSRADTKSSPSTRWGGRGWRVGGGEGGGCRSSDEALHPDLLGWEWSGKASWRRKQLNGLLRSVGCYQVKNWKEDILGVIPSFYSSAIFMVHSNAGETAVCVDTDMNRYLICEAQCRMKMQVPCSELIKNLKRKAASRVLSQVWGLVQLCASHAHEAGSGRPGSRIPAFQQGWGGWEGPSL